MMDRLQLGTTPLVTAFQEVAKFHYNQTPHKKEKETPSRFTI
jgi:hypothetical protein